MSIRRYSTHREEDKLPGFSSLLNGYGSTQVGWFVARIPSHRWRTGAVEGKHGWVKTPRGLSTDYRLQVKAGCTVRKGGSLQDSASDHRLLATGISRNPRRQAPCGVPSEVRYSARIQSGRVKAAGILRD
eukprot:5056435-Pyramimonas_sp.AAC.1